MEDDRGLKSMHRFQSLIYELLGDSLNNREDMVDELILIYSAFHGLTDKYTKGY